MIANKIVELKNELAMLERQQENCQHKFDDPYQDFDIKKIPIQENRPMGSDYFNSVTVGWKDKKIPVWRRKCSICGKIETTTNTEAVISHRKPVF